MKRPLPISEIIAKENDPLRGIAYPVLKWLLSILRNQAEAQKPSQRVLGVVLGDMCRSAYWHTEASDNQRAQALGAELSSILAERCPAHRKRRLRLTSAQIDMAYDIECIIALVKQSIKLREA